MKPMPLGGIAVCFTLFDLAAAAQPATPSFEQRGFVETDLSSFPATTSNDAGHFIGNGLLHWEFLWKAAPWISFTGGIDAEADTHFETERTPHLDWQDRGILRPAFDLRTFKATIHKDHFTLDVGKQFIRWGTADILNPTDCFAPRDYLSVVDNDFLGELAARAVLEGRGTSIELIASRFTPSRIPLFNQRWTALPPDFDFSLQNAGTRFPGGGQYGARLRHIGRLFEGSVSFFDGYNHLPLLASLSPPTSQLQLVERFYPKIRSYGADSAISLPWVTLKLEGAYIQGRSDDPSIPRSDDYFLYVAQLERQEGEWTFVGGYAGETVTEHRQAIDFNPERGLARAFIGRAAYNIGTRSTVSVEIAERQNGAGTWVVAEYSRLFGSHWRGTIDIVGIAGRPDDFLGQYNHNSHVILKLRYSF